jgi:hypothetical protein
MAHTDANLSQGEAEYYEELCSTFVQAMTVLRRGEGVAELGVEIGQPTFEAIEAFLLGPNTGTRTRLQFEATPQLA